MTSSFIARPADAVAWPFYPEQTSFRWAADDVTDVARFLGILPVDLEVSHEGHTVPSRLRGQRISLVLEPEWFPVIDSLGAAIEDAALQRLVLQTGPELDDGFRVAVLRMRDAIKIDVLGHMENRRAQRRRPGSSADESRAAWSMLGWTPGTERALVSREFPHTTSTGAIAYAIIELLALVEMTPGTAPHVRDKESGTWLPLSDVFATDLPSSFALLPVPSRDLEAVNTRHLDLRSTLILGANLHGCDLTRAIFDGSTLVDADMSDAILDGASFRNAALERVVFDRSSASFIDLAWSTISESRLDGVRWGETVLFNSRLNAVRGEGTRIEHLLASHAQLNGCRFHRSGFDGAEVTSGTISKSSFEHTELTRARFDGTRLDDVVFSDCTLVRASFQPVDERLVDEGIRSHPGFFTDDREERQARADLVESLNAGELRNIRFDHSDMSWANLTGADIRGFDFWGAKVDGLNLIDATLRGGEFSGQGWGTVHPFQRPEPDEATALTILAEFTERGLRLPHIPRDSGVGLRTLEGGSFATEGRNWPIPLADALHSLVSQLARGAWTPGLAFGRSLSGSGVERWTYLAVAGDVAIVAVLPAHDPARPDVSLASRWAELMSGISDFLDDVLPPEPDEERLLVVFNPADSEFGWTILHIDNSSPPPRFGLHHSTPVSATDFFHHAADWDQGPFRP